MKKQNKKRAHLLGFIQHGVNSHATGMWRHPKDKVGWHFARPQYWQHMARTMERGLFDAMFIADELAPYNTHEDRSDAIVRWAVQCPTHEPSTIVPIITTATEHLGVGVTLSTAFEHPYSMCRRLSSLDHLSNGRVAWNIVSSYSKSEWDAYGHSMTDRSGRYERLDEYMEVCYQLWDSLGARRHHRRQGERHLCRSGQGQSRPSRRQILQVPRPAFLCAVAARPPCALAGGVIQSGAGLCR